MPNDDLVTRGVAGSSLAAGRDTTPAVEIKVRDDGPYKVSGPVRLVDVDGATWAVPEGEAVVLCRCGRSATKPFCDGAHRGAGFSSRERASAS